MARSALNQVRVLEVENKKTDTESFNPPVSQMQKQYFLN